MVLDYRQIDLDNLRYNAPRKINGKYMAKVKYYDEKNDFMENIIIKLDSLKCRSSIIISENRCYLELELEADDDKLYNFFADLDDVNINMAYKNSKDWFGEEFPLDIIDDYHKQFIRLGGKNKKPSIKIKIPYEEGKILLENFNENHFQKDKTINCIIEYDGLRFLKQQFTSEWTLTGYEVENQYEFKEMTEEEVNEIEEIQQMTEIVPMGEIVSTEEEIDQTGEMESLESLDRTGEVEEDVKEIKVEIEKIQKEVKGMEEIQEKKVEIDTGEKKKREKKTKTKKKRIIKYAHKKRIWQ